MHARKLLPSGAKENFWLFLRGLLLLAPLILVGNGDALMGLMCGAAIGGPISHFGKGKNLRKTFIILFKKDEMSFRNDVRRVP